VQVITTRPFLSHRQQQCLRLAAAGLEHRQIAERLHLGYGTVVIHLTKAREALGARNTAHAVGLGIHHGIVTAEHLELP
jgi:DNA-binding CsgD family transcriptional regulator